MREREFVDERGEIHTFEVDGAEFSVMLTKKGYARGGDHHKTRQYVAALRGSIDLHIRKSDGEEGVYTVNAGEHFVILKNLPHYMVSTTDSITIEWIEGGYGDTEYDTVFRKRVVRLNQRVLGLDGETGQI